MKKFLCLSALLVSFAGAATAQSIADQVVSQLTAEGYEWIEVKNGLTQVKVEAVRNGVELEVVYDAATGAILKQETGPADADDANRRGVQIRSENRDFVGDRRSNSRDDDDDDDDRSGRDDRAGDDDRRDNSGHGNARDRDRDDDDDDHDDDDYDDDDDDHDDDDDDRDDDD